MGRWEVKVKFYAGTTELVIENPWETLYEELLTFHPDGF
jgi:hypothetical protein